MSWVIRQATARDAAFAGWASVMAARSQMPRGWFDIILRRDEAFVLAYAAALADTQARSWWHWSVFRVAEIDGVLASAMCGFGDNTPYMASTAAMTEASERMGISKAEQAELWPRGAFIVSTATSERGAWTIENVGTK